MFIKDFNPNNPRKDCKFTKTPEEEFGVAFVPEVIHRR